MKNIKITFALFLLSIISLLGLKIYSNLKISKDFKNEETFKLKKSAEVLNECLDLKNKSHRTLYDSRKLIAYCLKEYGYEK